MPGNLQANSWAQRKPIQKNRVPAAVGVPIDLTPVDHSRTALTMATLNGIFGEWRTGHFEEIEKNASLAARLYAYPMASYECRIDYGILVGKKR